MGDALTARLNLRIVDLSYAACILTCDQRVHCFESDVKGNQPRKSKDLNRPIEKVNAPVSRPMHVCKGKCNREWKNLYKQVPGSHNLR